MTDKSMKWKREVGVHTHDCACCHRVTVACQETFTKNRVVHYCTRQAGHSGRHRSLDVRPRA